MDKLIGLAPLILSRRIPFGNSQVCRGGDSRTCWALEGVGITAISLPTQTCLEREPRCPGTGCTAFHANPQKAGLCSGETLYYKLPDVSPSYLCGLLQIGPDLGTYLLPCVDPSVEWLFCTGSQRILPPAPIMLTGCRSKCPCESKLLCSTPVSPCLVRAEKSSLFKSIFVKNAINI